MDNYKSNLYSNYQDFLLHPPGFPHQSSGRFRPSEASAIINLPEGKKVVGACTRRVWYRLKGFPKEGRVPKASEIFRMNVGKQLEKSIVEDCKRMGLFIGNNIPFQVVINGVPIAGEIDVVLRTEPNGGQKVCVEVKSVYGYLATKEIFGNAQYDGSSPGKPRDSYLMQNGLYLSVFSKLQPTDPSYIPFGAIFVADRGDGEFGVFDTWLQVEHTILPEGGMISRNRIFYSSDHLNIPATPAPYTIEDIIDRYKFVQSNLKEDVPPPRDYCLEFSEKQVESKYASGDISKSAYEKWTKSHGPRGKGKEKLGDWQCGYCEYQGTCWS